MRTALLYLLLVGSIANTVWAQSATTSATLELGLARAVEIALSPEGSAKIALAEQSIVRSETQVQQARAALLPSLDGSAQERNLTTNLQAFGFNIQVPGFTLPTVVGPFNVVDLRATAKWTVLDFSTIRRYHASQASVDTAKADRDVTRTQVTEQVARAYLTTLRTDAAVEAAQANVDLSKALLDLAQSQKNAGTGTGIEVTRAQVQLANDNGRLTVAQNERARAALQLQRAMGLDLSIPLRLTGKLEYVPVTNATVDASLATAHADRAELRAQHQRETVARLNSSAVTAESLPSISTFGDYGGIGKPSVGLEQTHTLGVTLNIPIFDGGRRKARRDESDSQLRSEQLRTRDLEQQIELDVRLALTSLQSAQTQVATARDGLRLAQDEVEQAQRRYRAGVAVPLEITDAQARLDRARDNQIEALYNYNLARLDLATATGHLQEFVQ